MRSWIPELRLIHVSLRLASMKPRSGPQKCAYAYTSTGGRKHRSVKGVVVGSLFHTLVYIGMKRIKNSFRLPPYSDIEVLCFSLFSTWGVGGLRS